jgi:hypothetical protein
MARSAGRTRRGGGRDWIASTGGTSWGSINHPHEVRKGPTPNVCRAHRIPPFQRGPACPPARAIWPRGLQHALAGSNADQRLRERPSVDATQRESPESILGRPRLRRLSIEGRAMNHATAKPEVLRGMAGDEHLPVGRPTAYRHEVLFNDGQLPLTAVSIGKAFGPHQPEVISWPWIRLAIDERVVGLARDFTSACVGSEMTTQKPGLAVVHDTATIVSELVTNALAKTVHAVDPIDMFVALKVSIGSLGVAIQVWDNNNSEFPSIHTPDSSALDGRGILIIRALSRYMDALETMGLGKVVRALVPAHPCARKRRPPVGPISLPAQAYSGTTA